MKPNNDLSNISDSDLIDRYEQLKPFERVKLIPFFVERANSSELMLDKILSIVGSESEMKYKVVGVVKFAWVPAIYLLEEQNIENIAKLISVIKKWPLKERELFYEYVKNESFTQKYLDSLNPNKYQT